MSGGGKIVFIFDQVPYGGDDNGRHVEDHIENDTQCTAKGNLGILLHYFAEEEQGEKQMPPAAVH